MDNVKEKIGHVLKIKLTTEQVKSRDAFVDATTAGLTLDGILYWAEVWTGNYLQHVEEREGGRKLVLTDANVRKAWGLMAARKGVNWYSDPHTDQTDYDVAIQLLMFGEVKYG